MSLASKKEVKDNEMIPVLQNLIQENFKDRNFNTIVLASTVGISVRHLNRILKKADGSTLSQLIREARLLEAKKLLETQAVNTISEVCSKVGFKKPGYFSKIYKDRFGIKPAKYFDRSRK